MKHGNTRWAFTMAGIRHRDVPARLYPKPTWKGRRRGMPSYRRDAGPRTVLNALDRLAGSMGQLATPVRTWRSPKGSFATTRPAWGAFAHDAYLAS